MYSSQNTNFYFTDEFQFFCAPCTKPYQLLVKMMIIIKGRTPFSFSWIVAAWIFFQWIGKFIKNRLNNKKIKMIYLQNYFKFWAGIRLANSHLERTANISFFSFFITCSSIRQHMLFWIYFLPSSYYVFWSVLYVRVIQRHNITSENSLHSCLV